MTFMNKVVVEDPTALNAVLQPTGTTTGFANVTVAGERLGQPVTMTSAVMITFGGGRDQVETEPDLLSSAIFPQ
jgi:hypothetical protein